ncbi:hypothetical protein Tco_1103860 [Tanacetum coccineum]
MPSLTMKWLFSQFSDNLVSSHLLSILSKLARHEEKESPKTEKSSIKTSIELFFIDDASLDGSVPASNKGDAPAKPQQIITTNTLSNIKLPVLQKDDYDTWAMEMEHYLEYIDNEVWKVIQNGNSKKRVTKGKDGVYRVLPSTTQEEQFAEEKERKARTLLLMAIPKDHLRRFHGMDDAKEIWAAIKTRFGGNANSKKMQKAVLKQQFEAFTISSKESLEKGYDRECKFKGSKEGNRQEAGRSQNLKPVQTEKEALMTIDEVLLSLMQSYHVYSTCHQSNDSDGEQGTVSDHSVNDDPIPIPSIEQVTIATQKTQPQVPKPQQTVDPSCAQHVKTPRQPIRTPVTPSPIPSYNRQNWNQRMKRDLGIGYSFERKPCFVCGSLSHLIKDYDYYEKKMAREAAFKSTRVVKHSMNEREACQGFAEIVDFLRGSNLRYALTANPTIYDSLVKQFWQSAIASTKEDGFLEISATIDTIRYTISEASIRDSLQLDDATGITMLPNDDLFEGMGQIGYPTDGTFTFWKSFFTPQWRYLVHHLLHCISSKSGGWDQFGSNIATALICLSHCRVYNFSKLIFDGMMDNLKIQE